MNCYGFRVTIWNGDSCKKVAVFCVVLYVLHWKRRIISKNIYTGMPQSMKLYMRKSIFIKQLYKMPRYAVRSYEVTDGFKT